MQNRGVGYPYLWVGVRQDFFAEMIARRGVAGWNGWVEAMLARGHLHLAWDTPQPPPVWFSLDFAGMDCEGWKLDGVNLAVASTESARFRGASLRGSTWGWTPHADFRSSDLSGADFSLAEVSGCQFEEACLDGVKMEGAVHDPESPPSGLDDDLLRRCRPLVVPGMATGDAIPETTVTAQVSVASTPG